MSSKPEHDQDLAMMRLALDQARAAAARGETPVGAIVYRDGIVIASGANRREIDRDPTAHAEVLALREAGRVLNSWRLEECSMAVTLEPCPMCAGALVNARVKRLVYGAADPKMGAVDSLHRLCTDPRFNHRLEVRGGLLAEECGDLLRAFFKARRGNEKIPKPGAE
ncbi:MAG: tRNA adenosine(34) deaminase TadA [Planctomycetota bacterium]|nr:tRNA adenosine(34) deaminase TadA [Planctomycetota bacterium]